MKRSITPEALAEQRIRLNIILLEMQKLEFEGKEHSNIYKLWALKADQIKDDLGPL